MYVFLAVRKYIDRDPKEREGQGGRTLVLHNRYTIAHAPSVGGWRRGGGLFAVYRQHDDGLAWGTICSGRPWGKDGCCRFYLFFFFLERFFDWEKNWSSPSEYIYTYSKKVWV